MEEWLNCVICGAKNSVKPARNPVATMNAIRELGDRAWWSEDFNSTEQGLCARCNQFQWIPLTKIH